MRVSGVRRVAIDAFSCATHSGFACGWGGGGVCQGLRGGGGERGGGRLEVAGGGYSTLPPLHAPKFHEPSRQDQLDGLQTL